MHRPKISIRLPFLGIAYDGIRRIKNWDNENQVDLHADCGSILTSEVTATLTEAEIDAAEAEILRHLQAAEAVMQRLRAQKPALTTV